MSVTSLENNKYAVGVSIDQKKTFDTVDHDVLCKTLQFFGVHGIALIWIKNCFRNFDSEILNIACGVPQGSMLGPTKIIIM